MTDQLTTQQLDEIDTRATSEHLTPGPWQLDRESCDCGDGYGCSHGMFVTGVVTPVPTEIAAERCKRTGEQPRDYDFHRTEIGDFTDADWELMAHAREDVPALLAEIRRLRFRLAELGEQGPQDRETVSEAAQMYRSLRTAIERTMTDPDRWDGDEDESFHLARYVEWLAAGQPAAEGAQR